MKGRVLRLLLLMVFLAGSLGASGIGMGTAAAADERDGDPREWEEQVAADARGDVLLDWAGTIDLYYMTMGEVYSIGLGEPYLFIRIGFNVTQSGDEDIELPEDPQTLPDPIGTVFPPDLTDAVPPILFNLTFNVSGERDERIQLLSLDGGTTWTSDQGRFVSATGPVDGHNELLYLTAFRRFDLQDGDILSDHNVTALRDDRITDTMRGFEPLNDYSPEYYRVHPLLDRAREGQPLPIPLPVPVPEPEPPVPLPVPLPEPKDHVPDDPYPTPPNPGDVGVPEGAPTDDDLSEQDPTAPRDREEDPLEVDPARIVEDPQSGAAWHRAHRITDGTGRFVARAHKEFETASFNKLGFANFTLESRFEETDQQVGLFLAGAQGTRWLFRYALDMPLGVKTLPAGGTVDMGIIGVPGSLFSTSRAPVTAIFISDWGGIDFAPVTFVNTNLPENRDQTPPGPVLPTSLIVDIVNEDDPFRANEPRKIMVRVRDGDGHYTAGFESIRAYIYPAGSTQPAQPYQLQQKFFTPGVYEIDMVFHRPGAWIVDVYFFDYQINSQGTYPHIDFVVHVEYEGKADPIIPVPAALGSLGVLMLALVARERMSKTR